MVQVPTKRTGEPASAARLTSVTERTSSTSTSASAARSMRARASGEWSPGRRRRRRPRECFHRREYACRPPRTRLHTLAGRGLAVLPNGSRGGPASAMRKPRRSRFSQPRPRTMASYKEQNRERLVRLLDQAADAREPVHRAGSSLRSGMAARRWRISSLAAGPACTVHCSSGTVRPSARAAMNERTGRPLVRSTSCTLCPSSA